MNDLISVIVPVYNVERYVEACIRSICQQTYSHLEIILIDDGSKDRSGEWCDRFAERDNRIIVIHRENGGLSAARNTGIDAASGNYIVFIDSDDMIHPNMIEILYRNLRRNDADISICSHKLIEEDIFYEDVANESFIQSKESIFTGRECIKSFYDKTFAIDMIVVWNKLYKKEIFSAIRFPEGKIQEDEYVNYQILYSMKKCFYTDSRLYYYRQRSGSIMSGKKSGEKFKQHFLSTAEWYHARIKFFGEKGDVELYGLTSLMLQKTLVDNYIDIKEMFPAEKKMIHDLERMFFKNYKENIIKNREISILDKLKGLLFVLNKNIYAKLKKWDTKKYS